MTNCFGFSTAHICESPTHESHLLADAMTTATDLVVFDPPQRKSLTGPISNELLFTCQSFFFFSPPLSNDRGQYCANEFRFSRSRTDAIAR